VRVRVYACMRMCVYKSVHVCLPVLERTDRCSAGCLIIGGCKKKTIPVDSLLGGSKLVSKHFGGTQTGHALRAKQLKRLEPFQFDLSKLMSVAC
jgi:hypothetical protein